MTLADQFTLLSSPPDPARVKCVPEGTIMGKPRVCLWSSTWLQAPLYSAWAQWCLAEVPRWCIARDDPTAAFVGLPVVALPVSGYVLTPRRDARVLHIAAENADDFVARFSSSLRYGINWTKVAESYDAVHLCSYQAVCRHPAFYGWDCESTAWLHPAWESVTEVDITYLKTQAEDRLLKLKRESVTND